MHLLAVNRRHFFEGIWRIADPKITLASVSSMLLGAAVAARHGAIDWGWLAVTVLGIFFLEAAKNASGEIFDFDSGTDLAVAREDASPFSGGKRVLVDRLMSRGELASVAALFYAIGAALGLAVVLMHEPRVLWIGVAGVALAYFYHAPPIALSYRGLGEVAVGVAYGPLIAAGTYLVQRHAISSEVLLLSLPLALLLSAFLVINEFPDASADASANKRTLVVRLGKQRASRLYAGIACAAFILLALYPLLGLSRWIWLGSVALPFSCRAAHRLITRGTITEEIIPAQGWTLLAFLLFSGGVSLGLFFAGAST